MAPGEAECEDREMQAAPVRTLIVDDQPNFRSAARMVVDATEGFEVAGEAGSGESAVEMARDLDPDLILMDINLPGMNGLEATRLIVEESHGVVVLLVSTYDEADFGDQIANSRAAGFIPKASLEPDRLVRAWEGARPAAAGA